MIDNLPIPPVVGTFLKVVPYGTDEFIGEESWHVLYIRKSGLFLFIGFWRGYELSIAAGNWHKEEARLLLDGLGTTVFTDTLPYTEGLIQFQRQFKIQRESFSPILLAENELDGWSLLSWRGPFTYVGKDRFIEIDEVGMPESWQGIDEWINQFLTIS